MSRFRVSPYASGASGRSTLTRRAMIGGLAATAGAVAIGLSGCAPSGAGRTNIRFFESKPEVIGYFDDLIAKYNASQSKVYVTHDSTSIVAPQFVRGSVPDLALYNYNLEASRYVARGVLSDLSDLPEAKTIRPDVQKLVDQFATYPGRTSVLPYSITGAAVIYNKRMFAQHGVSVPTTWEEMVGVCQTLQSKGVTPIYGTFKDVWTLQQGAFDYAVGGAIDVAEFYRKLDAQGTDVHRDSPVSFVKDFSSPVTRMISLRQYMNKDAASKGYADGNLAFAKEEAAMYFQGPWAFGEIAKTAPKLSLGTFPLPMGDAASDRQIRINLDLAFWIPTQAAHPDEARDFLQYLMQPSVHNAYCRDNLSYGVTKDAPPATDPRISQLQPYVDAGRFYQGPQTYLPQSIPIGNYIQSAMTGGESGRSMLTTLDADWRRIALRDAAA